MGAGGGGGEAWEVLPLQKWGGGRSKGFSHAERGHKMFWGSIYVVASSSSHVEGWGGGSKSFHSLKDGGAKFFTLS